MLTYHIRPRIFRIDEGKTMSFPTDGLVRFKFSPLQPFGMEPGNGRTAVRGVAASILFNANTGSHTIESKDPLSPLDDTLEEPSRMVKLNGNILTIEQHFSSNAALTGFIQGIFYGMPPLMNVVYSDPPVIELVDGTIGNVDFRWEFQDWRLLYQTTSQENQEKLFASTWERIGLLSISTNTRLFAAIHFFYVAIRLQRQATLAGEFLSESLLNFSKILEVLFPPSGDGRTRDAARIGLGNLGYSEIDIEADFLPAMALRNEIDVGHVDLGLFKPEHLVLIHGYARRAEQAFRELIERILTKIESNEFTVEPYERSPARREAVAVVEKLNRFADRYAL
jgi:hypothetical protein